MKDDDGETALMMAAYGGYDLIIEDLVIAGADVNLENHKAQKAVDLVGLSSSTRQCLQSLPLLFEKRKADELELMIEHASAAGRREEDNMAFLGSGLDFSLVSFSILIRC